MITYIGILFIFCGLIAAIYAAKNIFKGMFMMLFTARKEWHNERLAICDKCEPHSDTCPVCHCFKVPKSMVKEETCPRGLWR